MTWSWILSTRFVQMEICNTRLSNMNSVRHWFSGRCHVSSFVFWVTIKFMLLTQKHKHITLHRVYLQYLNVWQSPSKQHNSHFDAADQEDKWMVGSELRRPASVWTSPFWEVRRKTHQMLTAPPLFIIFISQQVNALPIVLWDVCLKVALLNIQVLWDAMLGQQFLTFYGSQRPPHLELSIQRHQVTSQNTRMLTQDLLE